MLLGEAGCGLLDLRHDLVRLAVADVVPLLAGRQLVGVPLRPRADVVLARRRDRRVERGERHQQHGRLGRRTPRGELAVRGAQVGAARSKQLHRGVRRRARRRRIARQAVGAQPHHHADAVADADRGGRAVQQRLVAEQLERREHVAAGDDGAGSEVLAGRRRDAGDPVAGPGDRGRAVAEAHRAAEPAQSFGQGDGQRARTADRAAGRHPVHQRVPADQVGGGDLVHRRPGLRTEPASAVFSRSSAKCSSSSWSAGCRNWRDISSPPTSVALPAPQR